MDLEANALVGHNVIGDIKILNHVNFIDEFNLIGVIDTQIIVQDSGNQRLPKGLSDIVLHYNLYEKVYSRKKAKKAKGHPYILQKGDECRYSFS